MAELIGSTWQTFLMACLRALPGTGSSRDFALRCFCVLSMRLAGLRSSTWRRAAPVYHPALLRYIGLQRDSTCWRAAWGDDYRAASSTFQRIDIATSELAETIQFSPLRAPCDAPPADIGPKASAGAWTDAMAGECFPSSPAHLPAGAGDRVVRIGLSMISAENLGQL